jgi:hypothetical protein
MSVDFCLGEAPLIAEYHDGNISLWGIPVNGVQWNTNHERMESSQFKILSRVVCITRQITSRRIGYSEFIPHSLLHLYNSQLHKYCLLQYHNYFSRSHFYTLNNNGLHS